MKTKTADLSAVRPGRILLPRKYLRNKDQQDALFFLNLLQNFILYMFRIE